eukprot:2077448-Rhodomonas_salina.1
MEIAKKRIRVLSQSLRKSRTQESEERGGEDRIQETRGASRGEEMTKIKRRRGQEREERGRISARRKVGGETRSVEEERE